jgi:hypothetical protein
MKQCKSPNHGNKIAGDGWLQDANCSSGAACAEVRRPEDGRLHVAVANVSPGKPSVGNIPIPVASQGNDPVRLVTGSRLRMAHPLCMLSSGNIDSSNA